jgi:hypothetical protein
MVSMLTCWLGNALQPRFDADLASEDGDTGVGATDYLLGQSLAVFMAVGAVGQLYLNKSA